MSKIDSEQILDTKEISDQEFLDFVSDLFNEEFTNKLKLFLKLDPLNSIDDLIKLNEDFDLLKAAISKCLIDSNKDDENKKSKNLLELIEKLNFIHKTQTVLVIKNILKCDNSEDNYLFSNVDVSNYESINKRYKQLCVLFHSDKIELPNYLEEYSNELNVRINNSFDKLKEKLKKSSLSQNETEIENYESIGDKHYNLIIKDDDDNIDSNNEIKIIPISQESKQSLMLAYDNYIIACKMADKLKVIEKKITLRKKMSLCLLYVEKYLESQLVAISVVNLIKENKPDDENFKKEAEFLLRKVINHQNLNTTGDQENNSNNNNNTALRTTIIIENLNESNLNLTQLFNDKLKKIAKGILMASNNGLIEKSFRNDLFIKQIDNLRTRDQLSLTKKKNQEHHQQSSKLFLVGFNWNEKKTNTKNNKTAASAAANKKSEILGELLTNALKAYLERNYSQFLIELSKSFEINESLLVYDGIKKLEINPKNIIKVLTDIEISPDSIAYLFNLIANALISDQIKIESLDTNQVYELAFEILTSTLEDELSFKAYELDNEVADLLKKHIISKKNKSNKIFYQLNNNLIDECENFQQIKNDTKSSFLSRLNEVRIITCINITIIKLILNGLNGNEFARNALEKIRILLDETNYTLNTECQARIDLIEFFIWVLTGEESIYSNRLNIKPELKKDNEINLYKESIQKRDDLIKRLEEEKTPAVRVDILNKLGDLYYREGESIYLTNFPESLERFEKAKFYYNESKMVLSNDASTLGTINCHLKTYNYDKAIHLIQESLKENLFSSLPEFWFNSGVAFRKCSIKSNNKLQLAENCIKESIRLETNKQNKIKFERELKVIKNLKDLSVENRVSTYKEKKPEFDAVNYNTCSFEKDDNSYKILSIDGGGIRGIIPSVLLCEIEKRSHLPLSKLVDMFAGTSTGSIIAAGLTLPDDTIKNKPKYYASDLIDLYRGKSNQIFGNPSSIFKRLFTAKFDNAFLKKEFEGYFGDLKLDIALNELLIPTVNISNLNQKQIFTTYDAVNSPSKNFKYVDVLLASTAAPSYFPSHYIESIGHLVDGALIANNPSKLAFDHAVNTLKINSDKIKVFSFGTGVYLDSLKTSYGSKGLIHWGKNIFNVVTSGIEFEREIELSNLLVDRHKRLQIFLNRDIEIDNYIEVPNLINIAYEYVEELDNSEDNTLNKIVEILNKHKQ